MRIKRLLAMLCILLLSGCSVVRINSSNFDTTVDVVLSKQNKLYNQIGKGYKYFVPQGVSYIESDEYNDILYANGNYYYLFIDVIGYYYKIEQSIETSNGAYFYKLISSDDNFKYNGYLKISKYNEKYYLVKFLYNYASFETLVEEDALEQTVLDASYILSTIKYNDIVISLMLSDEYISNKEEKYDIFESKSDDDNKFQIKTNIEEG